MEENQKEEKSERHWYISENSPEGQRELKFPILELQLSYFITAT